MGIRTNYSKQDREAAQKRRGARGGPYPPEGEYRATVDDALEKESNAGNLMIQLELNVHAPDRTVKRKAWFVYDQEDRMINLVDALARPGDPEEISPERDGTIREFLGRECRVVIVHEPDKSGKIWANVDRLLPPSSSERGGDRGERGRDREERRGDERRDRGQGAHRSRDRDYDDVPF